MDPLEFIEWSTFIFVFFMFEKRKSHKTGSCKNDAGEKSLSNVRIFPPSNQILICSMLFKTEFKHHISTISGFILILQEEKTKL